MVVSKSSCIFVDPDEIQFYAAVHQGVWWGGVFLYVYRYNVHRLGRLFCFQNFHFVCVCGGGGGVGVSKMIFFRSMVSKLDYFWRSFLCFYGLFVRSRHRTGIYLVVSQNS